jgi:hypothetical protein
MKRIFKANASNEISLITGGKKTPIHLMISSMSYKIIPTENFIQTTFSKPTVSCIHRNKLLLAFLNR